MSLSQRLTATMAPTYAAILDHPFLAGLTDGSLDPACFSYYLIQDAGYLLEYARALAVVGARAPDARAVAMFARHAAGALEVERELHASLLPELGIDPALIEATEPAPTTVAYTSYLLATAYGGSYSDGLAAVLPCYWIYREVGAALIHRGSPDPRYSRWIDTYAGAEFDAVVSEVLSVVDGLEVAEVAEARMHRHAKLTARYEWLFWQMAWRREQWALT